MISWGWLKGHSLTKGTGEGLTAAMPVPQARVLQSNTSVQHKQLLSRVTRLCGCRAQTGRLLGTHWIQSKRKEGAGSTFAFLDEKTLTPFDSCFDSFKPGTAVRQPSK